MEAAKSFAALLLRSLYRYEVCVAVIAAVKIQADDFLVPVARQH